MSKEFILLFSVCFGSFVPSLAILDVNLMVQYCNVKKITILTVLSCQNKKENGQTMKTLARQGLHTLIINPYSQNFTFHKILKRKYYNMAVVLDADCLQILQTFSLENQFFYEPYHWLIISTQENENNTINYLKNTPLNINCDVNLAIYNNQSTNWTIFDVYNAAFHHQGQFNITKLGYYNENDGFCAKIKGSKYWMRKNMTGVKFTSAVVVPDPNVDLHEYLTSDSNRQINSMHRFQSVTVNYCKEMYNFTLSIQRTDSWGYMTPNGHFDGLVGLLERRVVDFGSSPLIYKLDRMPVVDYSYGNWILRSTFIYRRPKIVEASYEIFLRPLSKTVWICIVIMLLILLGFLKIIFTWEERSLRHANLIESSWSFLILFTLGAFCQQGATCYPKLFSSRTLSVFVFLFCILIYQFYSASIVSYLLMDPPRRINNLKDLTDSSLRTGVENIMIDRKYFVETTDPVAIELFNKKIKGNSNNSGFFGPWEGLRMVKEGGFAFHVETSTAYPIIEEIFTNQEICELDEVQMYRTQPMHTNLQKNSPFREMMNYCMLHLVENGIMYRLRKHWDARKPICIESAKKISIHVGLAEFSSGLIVLFYGICLSLISLSVEFVIARRNIVKDFWLKRKIITPFTK